MMTLPTSRAAIAALIPHQGAMCLLERVIQYDDEHIVCTSRSHLSKPHPLAHQQRIAALHLCEYGAQAAAVHGALLSAAAGTQVPQGLLVTLRDVQLSVDYLDEHAAARDARCELLISATRQHSGASGCMYTFNAEIDNALLVSGKVTIMNWAST